MDGYIWMPMSEEAVGRLSPIMEKAYPHLPDETTSFYQKRALYPEGCFILVPEAEPEHILGYVIAHPWRLNDIPPLNSVIEVLPGGCDVMYLHDIALLAEAQGIGAARAVLTKLDALAGRDGYSQIAITAIPQAVDYWHKRGFEEVHVPQLDEKLMEYGIGSKYMLHKVITTAEPEVAR